MNLQHLNRSLSDEDLIKLIVKTNDKALFRSLYDRHFDWVYKRCCYYTKNDDEAKDLSQDIFLDLYMKLNTFKGHSKFTSWLYAFTKNRCINYLNRTNFKKIDQRKDMNIDVSDLTLPFEDDNSKQVEEIEKLTVVMEQLPSSDKSILIAKYYNYKSIKELCDDLNISESAVKMRLKRARARLFNAYQKSFNDLIAFG